MDSDIFLPGAPPVNDAEKSTIDQLMMTRCIALSKASAKAGEYPYGAVICHEGKVLAESINRVMQDGDVTRHAEVVAISQAQKELGTVSLDDCEIYVNAEPCVFCCYAIRESRIRRVVYGLSSPHMGGVSKWNVLRDKGLGSVIPEVFSQPPEIVSGYMSNEAEKALFDWNPLIAAVIKRRGLFGAAPQVTDTIQGRPVQPGRLRTYVMRFLRRHVFDYFGRRRR
jgi:tRNA(adenine34) deaminase